MPHYMASHELTYIYMAMPHYMASHELTYILLTYERNIGLRDHVALKPYLPNSSGKLRNDPPNNVSRDVGK